MRTVVVKIDPGSLNAAASVADANGAEDAARHIKDGGALIGALRKLESGRDMYVQNMLGADYPDSKAMILDIIYKTAAGRRR